MDQAASQSLTTEFGEKILDPWWRISNLYTIITEDGQKIPFRPNEEQEQFFKRLWTRNIILKARQLGFTTLMCIVALDQAIFNDHFTAAIIAHKLPDAEKIFQNKILLAYKELPEAIRSLAPTEKLTESMIRFANGSSISVSTSARSGTLQLLHVSEFGKICAQRPAAAREIVTGAFEAVASGNIIVIESTAEGAEGYFHDYSMDAIRRKDEGAKLSSLDYRLHFFPWWKKRSYTLDPDGVLIPEDLKRYFEKLSAERSIALTAGQRAWYAKKKETLRGDMAREHPSFPEEAFQQTIEGAIYGKEMTWLRKNGRITDVPFDRSVPVNSFWDLGVNDANSIWFHQQIGPRHHFIKYFEDQGEGLSYYWRKMQEFAAEYGWIWGEHHLPHDADYRIQGEQIETKKDILEGMGMRGIVIVPRTPLIEVGIEKTRNALLSAWFDREGCAEGIKTLDNYQREWDENRGVFKSKPLHNWASNGSDAIRQWAQGYVGVAEARQAAMSNPVFSDPRFTQGRRPATRAGY